MRKARLSVYLDRPILDALTSYAARRQTSLSLVAEAAIVAFVSPNDTGDALQRRLARVDRQLEKLDRDIQISSEALFVFVWFWLMATPSIPESSSSAAQASATERYDVFMEALGKRLTENLPRGNHI
jgi:hypothetical protein